MARQLVITKIDSIKYKFVEGVNMGLPIEKANEPAFSKTSSRIFKIKCCGDSNAVADMLEDIAKKVRGGMIHCNDDMFYKVTSMGYVREENRGDWHERERKEKI